MKITVGELVKARDIARNERENRAVRRTGGYGAALVASTAFEKALYESEVQIEVPESDFECMKPFLDQVDKVDASDTNSIIQDEMAMSRFAERHL